MNLQRIDSGVSGDTGTLDVLADDPFDLVMIEDMYASMVEVAGERRRWSTWHAALLHQLNTEVRTFGVHPIGKNAHAFLELGVTEDARLLAERADAGGFETGDVHMLDVTGRTTDPRKAIVDASHPVVDEVVEA